MTELARQLIEQEKKARTGYLDLGRCGLSELPDTSDLGWLEMLVVSNRWWDWEKRQWVSSRNNGAANRFTAPPARSLPGGLKKIVLSGLGISDARFLEKLTGLTSLDLSSNQISDARFLEKLTGLTTLDLSSNQISDARFLEKLTGLTTLNLSSNQISDARFLEKLTGLTTLGLGSNQISDARFLEKLTGLTSLGLGSNQISDYSFLEKLTGLTSLGLSFNQISDYGFLEKLTGLTSLDLSRNKISDYSFLEKLTNLTTLDLGNNKISDARFLEKLTGLASLDLGYNQISDARFLEKLTGLASLDLGYNQISDYSFLEKLTGLASLDLGNNKISDARFLEKLTGLASLDLGYNQISDARFLEKLTGLTTLVLHSNQISDARFLEKLTGLASLDLRNNQISDARFLEKLTNLTTLDLGYNQISDARFLEKLTNLTTLALRRNQISDLRPLLPLLKKGLSVTMKENDLSGINLYGNPLGNPPVEVVQQGNEVILRYFEKFEDLRAEDIRYVDEAKVLLIGQPRAGKTTLRKKLLDVGAEMPKDEETTRGIDIESLHFEFRDATGRERKFIFNVWDFGGQEIYHATHRFFLTSRSLYIAVVNTDVNDKQNDLDYWLHIVELLGGDSPILMVQNQKNNREINVSKDLKDRFGHLLKKEYKLDLNRLNQQEEATFDQKRLDDFRQFEEELCVMLKHLPQTSIKVTQEELAVREAIADLAKTKAVIPKEEFFTLCDDKGLKDPDLQKDFLHLLHELGVLLHFERNEHLERVVILQNKWATDAVFKILDAPQVAKQQGHFSKKDSEIIWNSPEYRGKAVELRALMREFKLCYPIGDTDEFIAPQLLPTNPREGYQWQPGNEDLRMVVEYEFMPRGIMTQFIVGMHRNIAEGQRLVWQTGFVAEPKDLAETRAEASESYDSRRVEIKVQGPFAGILMQRLVDELRKIHDSYQNLKPDELLPCICEKCQSLPPEHRHHFKYKSLLNSLYVNRVSEKQCDKSDLPVPIERILGQAGFEKQKQARDAQRLLPREALDNRDLTERLERIEETALSTERNTFIMQSNQQVMVGKLNALLHYTGKHQAELEKVLEKMDALPGTDAAEFDRINDLLEARFGVLIEKLPNSHDIVRAWKEANTKLPHEADSKWKLKFKLPFILGELEKEFALDWNSIRKELTAFAKGEKTFAALFIED